MDKRKLLFVDDERNILDGLRRMLRSMRNEFDFFFAENAKDALAMMQEHDFDVVVSDMRMPGMDGADLLTEVQRKHPHSIRIMLTGQADDESTLRTIGVVHQFLAKPCDPEKLKVILVRASALHRLITDGNLKDMISSIDRLPSLPDVYVKLQKKLREPEVSLDEIGEIISQDIAMTAKILHLVNSAFFGLYTNVDSPVRAVKLIGLDTVKSLVLISKIFSETRLPTDLFPAQNLWEHCTVVGMFAKVIAESETDDKELVGNSYIAGVLHDIGRLILAFKLEKQYREAIDLARRQNMLLEQAERTIIKATHCEMGAYLIGLWGFQSDVVEAIGFHYKLEEYPADAFSPALAVHAAHVMYYKLHREDVIGLAPEFNVEYLRRIGMEDRLGKWEKLCIERMQRQTEKNDQG